MARRHCFTINNYTQNDIDLIEKAYDDEICVYIIYGKEVGEENGTPHLQGYMEYKGRPSFKKLKSYFPRAKLIFCKGTQKQNIKYCSKGGDITTYGEPKKQGERKDLDEARQLALDEGMRAVSYRCNYQQIKTAEKFLTYNEEIRDWKPNVIWIWGPTGAGKSFRAREIVGLEDTYTKNDGTKWWDGYDSHDNVIIDDFRDSWWSITEMLRLLDCYEARVEVKGGYRQFRPKTIIITSIRSPSECYKNCVGEPIQQLLRRITSVIHLEPDVPEVGGNTNSPDSDDDGVITDGELTWVEMK